MSEYRPLICLPVLPLRGIVVFPGIVTHFDVGRLKSAKAVDEAMRADQRIFLTAQKDLSVDDPKKSDLYTVGTIAVIKQILRLPGDNMRILVEGQSRAEMVDCIQSEPYLFAWKKSRCPRTTKRTPKCRRFCGRRTGRMSSLSIWRQKICRTGSCRSFRPTTQALSQTSSGRTARSRILTSRNFSSRCTP